MDLYVDQIHGESEVVLNDLQAIVAGTFTEARGYGPLAGCHRRMIPNFSTSITLLKITVVRVDRETKITQSSRNKIVAKKSSIMIHLSNYRQFFGVANRRYCPIMATREMYTPTLKVVRHVRTSSIVTNKLNKMANTRPTKTIIKSCFFCYCEKITSLLAVQ